MEDLKDITTMDDIQILVNAFYSKIREDELLSPIFNRIILDRWPQHLGKMYRFWQTVLLGEHTYHGSPFHPHARLPLEQKHFDVWLVHWHATINSHFKGNKATEAKSRADKMALMFLSKIEYYKNNTATPIL